MSTNNLEIKVSLNASGVPAEAGKVVSSVSGIGDAAKKAGETVKFSLDTAVSEAMTRLEARAKAAQAAIDALPGSTASLAAAAAQAQASLSSAFSALGMRTSKQIADDARTARDAFKTIASSGASESDIERAKGQLAAKFASLRQEMDATKLSADKLGQGTADLTNQLGDMGKLAVGFAVFSGVKSLFLDVTKSLTDTAIAADRFKYSYEFAMGGVTAGQRGFEYVRGAANSVGLELNTTAQAYAKLAAASIGTSLEGDKTRKIFESVAKASAVMGLSAEESNGALLAISQMMSKGTVQSEELRGQLGERLPGAFQMAARAMGVSTAELGKMLDQGQILSSDFLPKLAAEIERTLGDAPERAANSLQANLNRMSNAWETFKTNLVKGDSDNSLLSGLTVGLNNAAQQMDRLANKSDGMFARFFIGLGASEMGIINKVFGLGPNAAAGVPQTPDWMNQQRALIHQLQQERDKVGLNVFEALRLNQRIAFEQQALEDAMRANSQQKFTLDLKGEAQKALEQTQADNVDRYAKALKYGASNGNKAMEAQLKREEFEKSNGWLKQSNPAMYRTLKNSLEETLIDGNASAKDNEAMSARIEAAKKSAKEWTDWLNQEHEHFRVSTEEWVAGLNAYEETQINQHIQALQSRLASGNLKGADASKLRDQIKSLETERSTLPAKYARLAEDEQSKISRDLDTLLKGASVTESALQRAAAEFSEKYGKAGARMFADGNQEGMAAYGKAWEAYAAKGNFEDQKAIFDGRTKKMESDLSANQFDFALGKKSAIEALVGERNIREQALVDLQATRDSLADLAAKGSDPKLNDELERVNKQINSLKLNLQDVNFDDYWGGAAKAVRTYGIEAANVARQTEQMFGRAFSSLEDAAVTFAKSGKLSFSSFADTVITDLIRIQIRASMAPITSAFGNWLSGLTGGGKSSGGSAGSADVMAVSASAVSAKGNAFGEAGQIHAFANGGAFTNSVVSSPTYFRFANGGGFNTGLMGEAGPEAIMPLTRNANGQLGVRAQVSVGNSQTAQPIQLVFSPSYTIDARGAELGAAQRINSAIKQSQQETLANVQDLMDRRTAMTTGGRG